MKKLLLASSALVASASLAHAEVLLTGSAELGIFGGQEFGEDVDTQFHSDIDLDFSMSGQTDGGLTFGATFDIDSLNEENDSGNITAFDNADGGDDTSIFVSGAFGTLTMGDTDGALDFVMQEASIGASLIDDNEHLGWNGNDQLDGFFTDVNGQVARYDYTLGGFSVAVSAEVDDEPDTFNIDTSGSLADDIGDRIDEIDNDTVLGVGVRYEGSFSAFDFGAGLGYQRVGQSVGTDFVEENDDGENVFSDTEDSDAEAIGVSLDFSLDSGFQGVLNYSTYNNVFEAELGGVNAEDDLSDNTLVGTGFQLDDHYGIALGYEFGNFLVAANYGQFGFDEGEVDGYGLVANYDLGGGAELQAGYGRSEYSLDDDTLLNADFDDDDDKFETFSFGIAMSF